MSRKCNSYPSDINFRWLRRSKNASNCNVKGRFTSSPELSWSIFYKTASKFIRDNAEYIKCLLNK